jgi:hypothetical protein
MADENKPAFYPRVGNIKAKNFRSAKPMPFIDDERAMELPQYSENIRGLGGVDLSVPTKQNLELNRRITQRDADLMRQVQADRSIPEKLAGGLQAGRFMGSALTQAINSLPTRIAKGDEAADKFIQERIYKPEQPLAYEYAQDIGDFLEKLETEYKIPPVLPEAMALQFLTAPATSQATRAAGRGAEQAGRAMERSMEPVVRGALEQGGLPREMVMAMGANTQSNVIKPFGGNWLSGEDRLTVPENDLRRLKTQTIAGETPAQRIPKHEELLKDPTLNQDQIDRVLYQLEQTKGEAAIDKWIDSNLKNYVKKQMATPDDPVRRLAEEGIIHTPLRDDLDRAGYLEDTRKAEGYPAEGMGKSDLARRWENLSDDAIRVTKASAIQDQANTGAKLAVARAELDAYKKQIDEDFIDLLKDKGGLSDKDRKVFDMMPTVQKAEILGERQKLRELQGNVNDLLARESGFEKAAGELNPFVSKLDPETRLYSGSTYNLGFDHIIDVLREDVAAGRIRPEQLSKVSMEQAVRRTFEYDQEMAKRMREAQLKQQEGFPTYKEYPEGFRWIEIAPPKELPKGYSAILDDVTSSYKVVDENGKEAFPRKPNNLGHINVPYFKTAEEAIADALQRDPRLEDALKYEGDTMGHCVGGYCKDVRDGNTKIYSLRDARGEPHVTVEVRPNRNQLRADDLLPYKEAALEEAKRLPNGYTDADVRDIEIRMARENMPSNIIQIKGKGNAKPKDDYIPYVQDFVKSGNWAQVGDFRNTGLRLSEDAIGAEAMQALKAQGVEIPKYVTQEEAIKMSSEAMSKAGKLPPPEGMKRGGVVISNNPDAMMLELNNQKMAKGGLTKLLRAAPKSKAEIDVIARRMAPQLLGEFVRGEKGTQSVAGKTQKQFAKEKEMVHDIRPTGAERPLPREVDIEELKDQVMVGIAGDPTISGQTLYSVDGVPLDSPSPQHGGPFYGLGRDDAFWASGLSAANRVQNVAREASEQYDLPVLGNYVMMGPDSINYAQHYADANLAAIDLNKMNRAQVEAFNNLVREGYPYKKKGEDFMRQRVFPAFPGIENPSEAYLHFSIDPELRKYFNALMQMPTVTEKYNLPSGIDIRHAVTEPDLRDLEIGVTGKSIGRLRPEVTKLGLSEHPTYSHDIPGEFMGSSKYPVPYELSFPDTVKSVRENPKQAPQEFGSFKYVGPRQVIDQQLIDEIKQYQEMIKKYTGKKEGGYIKKPAAYLNGDEFVNAAKKYGIKDSMNNLNKIVDLVNKGLSVDDAARQVADSGMHKAAGGAIRGDDLILEERPL